MKKTATKVFLCAAVMIAASSVFTPTFAQEREPGIAQNVYTPENEALMASEKEKPELILGADLVSSYVWRGVYQGSGPSIQPTFGVGYKGFSLTAWGSVDFNTGFKELDFTLAYEYKGLTVSVTDYWWEGQGSPFYTDYLDNHSFEAGLTYTISENFPLTIGWHTFFAGNKDRDEETGERKFSTAISLGYEFSLKNGYSLELGVIVSPWASPVWLTPAPKRVGSFQATALQAIARKKIKVTEKFSIPVSVALIGSPATDDAHIVAALNF